MKTTTTADRINALVAFINAEDIRQGRPTGHPARTAENLEIAPSPHYLGDQVFTAYLDNNVGETDFAVLTMDESATTTLLPCRDYGEQDCISINGVTFLVVHLGDEEDDLRMERLDRDARFWDVRHDDAEDNG